VTAAAANARPLPSRLRPSQAGACDRPRVSTSGVRPGVRCGGHPAVCDAPPVHPSAQVSCRSSMRPAGQAGVHPPASRRTPGVHPSAQVSARVRLQRPRSQTVPALRDGAGSARTSATSARRAPTLVALAPTVAPRAAPRATRALACATPGHPRCLAGAAAPPPGGYRRATGGTPDPWTTGPPGPCPAARWSARRPPGPSRVPSRRVLGRRPRTNDLAAGRCGAGWYSRRVGHRPRRGRDPAPVRVRPIPAPASSPWCPLGVRWPVRLEPSTASSKAGSDGQRTTCALEVYQAELTSVS
jgi:hypothetical protein